MKGAIMNQVRCFNCEKSLYRLVKGEPEHKETCTSRSIVIAGDQLFKKRYCHYFELRSEKRVRVKVSIKEQIPEKINQRITTKTR
jgi:hypothetical protein